MFVGETVQGLTCLRRGGEEMCALSFWSQPGCLVAACMEYCFGVLGGRVFSEINPVVSKDVSGMVTVNFYTKINHIYLTQAYIDILLGHDTYVIIKLIKLEFKMLHLCVGPL